MKQECRETAGCTFKGIYTGGKQEKERRGNINREITVEGKRASSLSGALLLTSAGQHVADTRELE
jgi:hypothetical protein